MSPDLKKSRLLANRYQLVGLVGKGSMGEVYQANDVLLGGVSVAVKFLSQALLNQTKRDRFQREATICALLGETSIHIVRVRDYGLDEREIPFYVMEYLQGESLRAIIKPQPLPLPRFLNLSRQICLGLQCAHQGILMNDNLSPIIHRDIKPSNILILQDHSVGELAKILDFGIAQLQSDIIKPRSFMGTPAYCSPEQMLGKELDNRSDIYSLGVMMFEMLTGEKPIKAEINSLPGWQKAHLSQTPSFESIRSDFKLPKKLQDLVISCLAKSSSDRPESVTAILRELASLEKKFANQQAEQHKDAIFTQPPPTTEPKTKSPQGFDEIFWVTSWPKDKPQAEIVFPHILHNNHQSFATLWVMFSQEEIKKRLLSTRYNQFLFLVSPHPMILWITTLYTKEHGARWLPCYLDLKTSVGQKITRLLADTGRYRILLFAIEQPSRCSQVVTATIAPAQCKLLESWANMSNTAISLSDGQMSKKLLKQELDKLKPKILMRLSATQTDLPRDISG
ncbi:MAG TPA: serine/threonine-protein kinase [Oculatellaceae cyanobacterium]|jgi:serine/threonine-protein kinase